MNDFSSDSVTPTSNSPDNGPKVNNNGENNNNETSTVGDNLSFTNEIKRSFNIIATTQIASTETVTASAPTTETTTDDATITTEDVNKTASTVNSPNNTKIL